MDHYCTDSKLPEHRKAVTIFALHKIVLHRGQKLAVLDQKMKKPNPLKKPFTKLQIGHRPLFF
jgi:hypothetical protein